MNDIIQASGALRTSLEIAQIAGALATAQGTFANPVKDKIAKVRMKAGGEYSFAYADLASVFDAIRAPLALNGLALIQAPKIDYLPDNIALVTVTTRLVHSSGEWLECDVTMGAEEQRPQVVSSAITYAKRYGLQALLGVVADEDDDGNAATGNQAQINQRARKEAAPAPAPKASPTPTTPSVSAKPVASAPSPVMDTTRTATGKSNPQRYEDACDEICRKIGMKPGNELILEIKNRHGGEHANADQKMKCLLETEKAALVTHD